MTETQGIDIAVIDSGVNAEHSHVGHIESGVSLETDSKGYIVFGEDFSDEIGHGTAIAGVIRWKAPSARLHAVKIFQRDLKASASLLLAAIEWALAADMRIIHLSLGIEGGAKADALTAACRAAHEKNIVIIASARSLDDAILPASLDSALGVCRSDACDTDNLIYYPGGRIEFGAHGMPRPLPGTPGDANFSGHSFAAAHVTARVARLLEHNPHGGTTWVRQELALSAKTTGKS
jgi:subtilisin family serine protease